MHQFQRMLPVSPGVEVTSAWAVPETYVPGAGDAIILAHGAGNDMHSAFMRDMHRGVAAHGLMGVTFNFPYKERGLIAPNRPPVLEATWRAIIAAVRADAEFAPARLFIGGKSMGGRIAAHVAAGGEACAGLVFLGYPLHPPRQPDKLRAEVLTRVRCPMLFVQGTRDPLCDLLLLDRVLATVAAPVTLHRIEGGDHSFHVPKRAGRGDDDIRREIVETVATWVGAQAPAKAEGVPSSG